MICIISQMILMIVPKFIIIQIYKNIL